VISSPPSLIIRAVLASGDSGDIFTLPSAEEDWPLYVSSMPDGDAVADDCGCVYDTSPVSDGREMKDGAVLEHYGIQLRVRSSTYNDGYTQIASAMEILESLNQVSVSIGTTVFTLHCCSIFGGITPIGAEPGTTKRRDEFTLNFRVSISQ